MKEYHKLFLMMLDVKKNKDFSKWLIEEMKKEGKNNR